MRTVGMLRLCAALLVGAFLVFGCENATSPEEGSGNTHSFEMLASGLVDTLTFYSGNGVCGGPDSLVLARTHPDSLAQFALIGGGNDSLECSCDIAGDPASTALPVTTHSPEDSAAWFETGFEIGPYFKDVHLALSVVADDGAEIYLNGEFIAQIDMFDAAEPGVRKVRHLDIMGDDLFTDGMNSLEFHVVNTGTGFYGDPAARTDSTDCMYVEFQGSVSYTACEVEIDIKPGSDCNPVNCKSMNGVIPVAILSTDCFDAALVDHTTVVFGPDEAMEAHSNKHGIKRHEEDVDFDGDIDLVFHFRGYETGIVCGDTAVVLKGMTYDGEMFEATDRIRTVPGDRPDSTCCED